jgi:RimJ/RimL family protein N-acetyltransferase
VPGRARTDDVKSVPYRIETDRLVIRCWSPEDAAAVHHAEASSREHLHPFIAWAHVIESMDDTVAKLVRFRTLFDRGEDFVYGVFDPNTKEVVGGTGLHPRVGRGGVEIGYWVHGDRVRRGYATEIAGALTRVAFELGEVRFVEIRTVPENVASAAVPKKLGFTLEATLRERLLLPDGAFGDALVFSLFEREYRNSEAKKTALCAFDAAGRTLL